MLCITRKIGETIVIDGEITLKVIGVEGRRIRLGFEGRKDAKIVRGELIQPARDQAPAAV